MSMPIVGEHQNQEIETIKERQITVELSDADCNRLVKKCGEYGLTGNQRKNQTWMKKLNV